MSRSFFFFLCIGLAFPFLLATFAINATFLMHTQNRFPDIWSRLGRPSGFLATQSRPSSNFSRFLLSGEFKKIGDPSFTKLGNWARFSLLGSFALILLGILLMQFVGDA